MHKPLLASVLLLAACSGDRTVPCQVDDRTVIDYVIADLNLKRIMPLTFTSKQVVYDLCKHVHPDPIGCTVATHTVIYKGLKNRERVSVIAHELKHQQQFETLANRDWTPPYTLDESEAYAYGESIMKKTCL